ncbi:MAG: hypothetical protein KDA37_13415 [Planctomycetales bacterium]|nr:hypothetical protein [Planctomycetales bacterium]
MSVALLASLFGRMSLLSVALWSSLAISTIALLVLMRTRWGQQRPTHRYALLSVVAHLLLICVATTIHFAVSPAGNGPEPVQVRMVMRSRPEQVEVDEQPETPPETPEVDAPEPETAQDSPSDGAAVPQEPSAALPLPTELLQPDPTAAAPQPSQQAPLVAPPLPSLASVEPAPVAAETVPVERLVAVEPASEPTEPHAEPPPPNPQPASPQKPAPAALSSREGEERVRLIREEGGDSFTEDAVAMALAWLATAQSPDGRWDADRWSAGRERREILGHSRTGVGLNADTAMTSLALLTLMGAGHTHLEGPFAEVLRDGLSYLMRTQGADGNLFGAASPYAQTYCHSMATFALAEAYALTGDKRLEPAVRHAVAFLVSRQDHSGGGWRYQAGRPGDTSQMGWIVMALRSAELADIAIPPNAWDGIERFLQSTQRGRAGGQASYMPSSPPSHSMTAESFYCRQILGKPIAGPTSIEAVDTILREPPGEGRTNFYAWYYGTLALHHNRRESTSAGNAWRQWNDALKRTLVASQVTEGVNKGSWSPNSVWGGCGGRVYTTALAAMCLEVYYRYDPDQLVRDPWIAARGYPAQFR